MKVLSKSKRKPELSRARRRRQAARQRKALDFQTLEDRRMLAVITVDLLTDDVAPDGS